MTWITIALAAIALMMGISYKMLCPKCEPDNHVEETIEKAIEETTGVEVDLSP